jgi:hypothetical protein
MKLETHPDPAWRERGDITVTVLLDFSADPSNHYLEELWCRKIAEDRMELCCIPFFAYNVSLGDVMIVEPAAEGRYDIRGVDQRSGRFTFRVWSPDSTAADLRKLLQEVRAIGCLTEPHPIRCGFAVDAESIEKRNTVEEILKRNQSPGHIQYEKSDGLTDLNIKVHHHPAWRDRSDHLLRAPVDHAGEGNYFEQLWTRRIGDNRHEICCVPLFIYDLALGDIVEFYEGKVAAESFALVKPSGHETYWIWISDDCSARAMEQIRGQLLENELEHEGFGFKLLAVDLPPNKSKKILDEIFAKPAADGLLEYGSSREPSDE